MMFTDFDAWKILKETDPEKQEEMIMAIPEADREKLLKKYLPAIQKEIEKLHKRIEKQHKEIEKQHEEIEARHKGD